MTTRALRSISLETLRNRAFVFFYFVYELLQGFQEILVAYPLIPSFALKQVVKLEEQIFL